MGQEGANGEGPRVSEQGLGLAWLLMPVGLLHLRLRTDLEAGSHPLNTGKGGWRPRIPTVMGHFTLVYDEKERLLLRYNQGAAQS